MAVVEWHPQEKKTIEDLSHDFFGTADYKAVLNVLVPSSALVKQFKKACLQHGVKWED